MTKLSASRIACILRCPREYSYKYILEIPQADTKKALVFGKAFHALLEGQPPDLAPLLTIDAEYPWKPALRVMFAGYKAQMELLGTSFSDGQSQREVHWETEEAQGYVDEIRHFHNGSWYIVENKTASKISETKRLMIPREIQTVAYVSHVEEIAEQLWLDPALFTGVVYSNTLKPLERRKKDETVEDFGERLTSSTEIWIYDRALFKNARERWHRICDLAHANIEDVHQCCDASPDAKTTVQNTAQCERFGNRCPYFEQCHGETAT